MPSEKTKHQPKRRMRRTSRTQNPQPWRQPLRQLLRTVPKNRKVRSDWGLPPEPKLRARRQCRFFRKPRSCRWRPRCRTCRLHPKLPPHPAWTRRRARRQRQGPRRTRPRSRCRWNQYRTSPRRFPQRSSRPLTFPSRPPHATGQCPERTSRSRRSSRRYCPHRHRAPSWTSRQRFRPRRPHRSNRPQCAHAGIRGRPQWRLQAPQTCWARGRRGTFSRNST